MTVEYFTVEDNTQEFRTVVLGAFLRKCDAESFSQTAYGRDAYGTPGTIRTYGPIPIAETLNEGIELAIERIKNEALAKLTPKEREVLRV